MHGLQRDDSPIEEYESRQAERSQLAVALVQKIFVWWLASHLAAGVGFYLALDAFQLKKPNGPDFFVPFVMFLTAGPISLIAGLIAFVTTLWRWRLLPWRWRIGGLVPWLVILAEFTPVTIKFVI